MAEEKTEETTEKTTPEVPAEKPEFPKEAIDTITALRDDRSSARDAAHAAQLESARLQGENEALKAERVAASTPKSPLDLAKEQAKAEGVEPVFTTELYERQRTFDDQQAQGRQQQVEHSQKKSAYETGMRSLPVDEQNTLAAMGGYLLTVGDKQNIFDAGANSGAEFKRIITNRIIQAGGDNAARLQPKPTKEDDKLTDEQKAEKEKVEAEAKLKAEVPEMDEVFDTQTERAYQMFVPEK